jgi:hypothetical protein
LARDLFDRNDKKSSATYFECFIGYLFAKKFGCNPAAQETFQIGNKLVSLPTDFIFKTEKQNIHLPVKTSTRERIIQAWAHQRILTEQTQGDFKGLLVIFSETKLDANNHEVIDVCVPDQWLIYQKYLARIDEFIILIFLKNMFNCKQHIRTCSISDRLPKHFNRNQRNSFNSVSIGSAY